MADVFGTGGLDQTQDLKKLQLDDKYSLVTKRRAALHVPLPPSYIGSRSKGVRELLDGWKGQYVQRLHGVLLHYEKLHFEQRCSTIVDDQPFVHEVVSADFYVFVPEVGSIVRGSINRMSKMHVGCLVHGCINASIFVPESPPADLVRYLHVGQEVLCKILAVSMHRSNTIRLRASFTRDCIQLMVEDIAASTAAPSDWELEDAFSTCGEEGEESVSEQQQISYLSEEDEYLVRPSLLSAEESLPKKKKKKKDKHKEDGSETKHKDSARQKKEKKEKKKRPVSETSTDPVDSDETVDLGPVDDDRESTPRLQKKLKKEELKYVEQDSESTATLESDAGGSKRVQKTGLQTWDTFFTESPPEKKKKAKKQKKERKDNRESHFIASTPGYDERGTVVDHDWSTGLRDTSFLWSPEKKTKKKIKCDPCALQSDGKEAATDDASLLSSMKKKKKKAKEDLAWDTTPATQSYEDGAGTKERFMDEEAVLLETLPGTSSSCKKKKKKKAETVSRDQESQPRGFLYDEITDTEVFDECRKETSKRGSKHGCSVAEGAGNSVKKKKKVL